MLRLGKLVMAGVLGTTAGALAQPQIISLGSGVPSSTTVMSGGSVIVGGGASSVVGATRWTLSGAALSVQQIASSGGGLVSANGQFSVLQILNQNPQVSGNTATGVTPPFNPNPTLVPSPLATTESRVALYNAATNTIQDMGSLPIVPSLMVYGSGSSGSTSGSFLAANAISQDGRFVIGQGYISTYNSSAGTTISANSFQWRPWLWDAQANGGQGGYTILPTTFRTSSNTWRRRTGNPYGISNDGSVIVGAQEHNVGSSAAADPDGGRLVVWRLNSGTGLYEMTYLPNGQTSAGLNYTYSTTPGTVFINGAGDLIVGRAIDTNGNGYIGKWTWDAGTSSWSNPINLGSNLTTQASWLPGAVTSCGVPPVLTPTGMSDDGSTIVGMAVYSTCGSFMSGGFIWQSSTGLITDWYDYLSEAGVAGVTQYYGPIGDNGDPNRGLPALGFPSGISLDGNILVGFQGGTQRVIGAVPWMLVNSGGPGCVSPLITNNPTASTTFSACSSSIILNVAAAGTLPIGFQWSKNGNALVDGTSPSGSVIAGSQSSQLRVNWQLTQADAGTYTATATGGCGSPASSTNAVVITDSAFPVPANDTCAGAIIVNAGTNVLSPAQSPCGAYANDPIGYASCFSGGTRNDVWFKFTPATSGNFRFETCGSNYDTVLGLFADCFGTEVACNDNYATGPSSGCSSARSRIPSVALTAGNTYYIRLSAPIGAFLSSTSTMNLSILSAPAAAVNDTCETALPASIGSNPFDTTEATNDTTATCNTALSRDVWFRFTALGAGTLRAATCPGTTINTVLSIYDACFGAEIACNDNASITGCSTQSIIDNIPMNAGQTYYLRVGTNSATTFGAGVLTLSYRCRADFNQSGAVNSQDLFDFITAFFGALPTADFNGDNVVNSQDFFDFLAAFFAPC